MRQLVDDLSATSACRMFPGLLANNLHDAVSECDVIIQATPVGMHGHAEAERIVPVPLLRPEHIVFDMVYRPMKTRLLKDAEAIGCTTVLGLEMLLYQAVLQFELWTGRAAPEAVMRDALVKALSTTM